MATATVGQSIGGAEETVNLVAIFGILAIIVYAFYKFPDAAAEIKKDFGAAWNGLLNAFDFSGYNSTTGYAPPATDIGGYDTPSSPGMPATSTTGQGTVTMLGGNNCFTCDAGLVVAGLCDEAHLGTTICSPVGTP